ncbi:YbaB/EbfC family nucleoid-associated protein [Nocardia lasii]|uniref:YbaB/EbfC family nucleoid-associated protein n=1 Tax=Nocardia lasii TaxID=1616107 RepID=A0ABW1JR64_9NOCA
MAAQQDEFDRVGEQLSQLRGSAQSADRSVALETDASGRITSLYLADYAMDNGPHLLASLVVDRHRAAMNDVEAKAVAVFEAIPRSVGASNSTTSGHAASVPYEEDETFTYIPSHLRRD